MNGLREAVRWIWWTVAFLDAVSFFFAWLELWQKTDRSWTYIRRLILGDFFNSVQTVIGLLLFGLNVKTHFGFLVFGLGVAVYRGYASTGWLLFVRGLLNGGGWMGLLLKRKH